METEHIVCDLIEAPPAPGKALIVPWGTTTANGKTFIVNDESWQLIRAAFAEHGTELPIDYEHQTLGGQFASVTGKSPAAGWIRNLVAEPGRGIFGDISWTPIGARHVYAKEYRYLSPVVQYRKADNLATALHSAALTNKPAIAHMPALAAKEQINPITGAQSMESLLTYLREQYGLAADATPEQILKAMQAAPDVAANSAQLVANVDDLQKENGNLRSQLSDAKADVLMNVHSGKIVAAQCSWFRDYHRRNPAEAEAYLKNAPVLFSTERNKHLEGFAVGTPGGQNRTSIVHGSRRTFSDAKSLGGVACSERAWVNEKLADAGLALLTKEEAAGLGIFTD